MANKPGITFRSDALPKIRDLIRQFPFEYFDGVKADFDKQGTAYQKEMVARSSTGPVYERTGRLKRSWRYEFEGGSLKTLQASVVSYSDSKVLTLEFGGTKKAPYPGWFFIPTDSNRTLAGRTIKSVTQVRNEGGRFINRSKERRDGPPSPPAVIYGETWRAWNLLVSADRVPMFAQTKTITHKAMLGFRETGDKYAGRIVQRLADRVVDVWRAAS